MSIAAADLDIPHIHSLKDDLESILYVVLYCTSLWLPVTHPKGLDWWLTGFFSINRQVGGAPLKELNAITRVFTKGLATT